LDLLRLKGFFDEYGVRRRIFHDLGRGSGLAKILTLGPSLTLTFLLERANQIV
jgi:hypothetical protein